MNHEPVMQPKITSLASLFTPSPWRFYDGWENYPLMDLSFEELSEKK